MTNEKKYLSRRNFITRALSGMASLGFLGLTGKTEEVIKPNESELNSKDNVIYRTLGKTGIRLPIVNMGVMNTLDSALIKRSYEIGVRHFDTSAWYMRGRNEEILGNTIKELDVRDKVIIGTKIYIPRQQREISPEQAKETYLKIANESLKRLQTDYVDILYSHVVESIDWLNNPGILEAFKLLKEQNKARFIGFSTHQNMAECINEAARDGFYDVVLTALNYSMHENRELIKSMEKASAKGIGIIAMKTQCSQPWYRSDYEPTESHQLYEGQIMQTALLKWVLRHDFITTAIPGVQNFQELEEDFSVTYDLKYTTEERKFLQDRNIKLGMASVCQQCYACVPTCPNGVDIPTLIRTHMYATCYTNFYQARATLNEIPNGKGLDICVSCSRCTANCVNRVDIAGRIDELKTIYA